MSATAVYPIGRAARDRFVLERRGPRPPHDPWRHQGLIVEDERDGATAASLDVATVFLTGRECPWRCVMCDLWRHTTATDTPPRRDSARRSRLARLGARASRLAVQPSI